MYRYIIAITFNLMEAPLATILILILLATINPQNYMGVNICKSAQFSKSCSGSILVCLKHTKILPEHHNNVDFTQCTTVICKKCVG